MKGILIRTYLFVTAVILVFGAGVVTSTTTYAQSITPAAPEGNQTVQFQDQARGTISIDGIDAPSNTNVQCAKDGNNTYCRYQAPGSQSWVYGNGCEITTASNTVNGSIAQSTPNSITCRSALTDGLGNTPTYEAIRQKANITNNVTQQNNQNQNINIKLNDVKEITIDGNGTVVDGDCDAESKVCRATVNGQLTFFSNCNPYSNGSNEYNCQQKCTATGNPAIVGDLQNCEATGAPAQKTQDNKTTGGGLLSGMLGVVSSLLIGLVWIIASLLQGVLWVITTVFIILVRINPAGSGFISVAIEPWRIVVSIANLIVLLAFLYTGFRYILGVPTKQKLEDFILGVIVVTLLLNFTIFGAASFVNIFHGMGDAIIGGYTAVSSQKSPREAIVGNTLNGIRNVSILRCGNLSAVEGGSEQAEDSCEENNWLQQGTAPMVNILNGRTSTNNAVLIAEITFCIILGFAIFVFWKAMLIAMIRVVGLWLLMVTSPFALAAAFSPIPQLKKLSEQWLEQFINLSIFYPVFVLGLILVGVLSNTFGSATRSQIFRLVEEEQAGSGVIVNAAGNNTELLATIFMVILTGIVTLGALNMLLSFVKTMDKLAAGVIGAAKQIWDKTKMAGSLLGGGARGMGSAADKLTGANKVREKATKDLSATNDNLAKLNTKLKNASSQKEKRDIQKQIATAERKKQELEKKTKYQSFLTKGFNKIGNAIEFAPHLMETGVDLAKGFMSTTDKARQARADQFKTGILGNLEYNLRRNGWADKLKEMGYDIDADPNMRMFAGMTKEVLATQEISDPKYRSTVIDAAKQKAYAQKLGTASIRMRQDAALAMVDYILDKMPQDLSDPRWTDEMRQIMLNLVEQGATDSGIARKLFSSIKGQNLSKAVYNNLNGEAQEKIANQYPQILDESSQYRFGADLAGDDMALQKLDNAGLTDNVIQGYLDNGGDKSKVFARLNAQGSYNSASNEQARRDTNQLLGGEIRPDLRQSYKQAQRAINQSGMLAERDIQRAIAELPSNLSPEERRQKVNQIIKQAKQQEYGGQELAQIQAADLPTLMSTNVGQMVAASVDGFENLSDQQKTELLRRTNMEYFQSRELNAEKEVVRHTTIANAYRNEREKQLQANAILGTYNKALEELAQNPAQAQADLRDNQVLHAVMGAQKIHTAVNQAARSGGSISGTFLPETFFQVDDNNNQRNSLERQTLAEEINKQMVLTTNSDPQIRDQAYQELSRITGVKASDIQQNLTRVGETQARQFATKIKQTPQGDIDPASLADIVDKQIAANKAAMVKNNEQVYQQTRALDPKAMQELVEAYKHGGSSGYQSGNSTQLSPAAIARRQQEEQERNRPKIEPIPGSEHFGGEKQYRYQVPGQPVEIINQQELDRRMAQQPPQQPPQPQQPSQPTPGNRPPAPGNNPQPNRRPNNPSNNP